MSPKPLDTPNQPQGEPHGWLGTETLKTRFGDFEFKNGYPVGDTAERLLDLQKLNRAIEVYLTQMMPVSEIALREGLRAFGATKPTQVVIWENLMDAKTVLLTANTETVYAISHLDLKAVTVRPWSRRRRTCSASFRTACSATSPTSVRWGRTRARAENSSSCRRASQAACPTAISSSRSPTYSVTFAVRGFQVDGKTDQAVALMKQIKVYPLAKASSPPPMEFMNGSARHRHAVSRTTSASSNCWRCSSTKSRWRAFGPLERWQMQAIGIEKGKPFAPDEKTKALLSEAARLGGAIARANTYARRRRASTTTPTASGRRSGAA